VNVWFFGKEISAWSSTKNEDGLVKDGTLGNSTSDAERATSSIPKRTFALLSNRKDRVQRTKQVCSL